MSWNYRIIREEDPLVDGEAQSTYTVYCVHYDNGMPTSYSGPVSPFGLTVEELSNDLAWMIKALTLPVLSSDMKEVGPAQLLTDDLLAAIERDPQNFPDMLRKSAGSA
jgi:hypothetical protein